jgi:hypothetical protein
VAPVTSGTGTYAGITGEIVLDGQFTGPSPPAVSGTASGSVSYGPIAPEFTSAASTSVTAQTPLNFTVEASGNPLPGLTKTGTLPAGATFSDNGDGTATLGGTPTQAGTFPLTFRASNGELPDAEQSFVLTVTAGPVVPQIKSITPSSLKLGHVAGLTVAGQGLTTTATLTFSNPRIVVLSYKYRAATKRQPPKVIARIATGLDAPLGPVNITATNADGGTGTCMACVSVVTPAP